MNEAVILIVISAVLSTELQQVLGGYGSISTHSNNPNLMTNSAAVTSVTYKNLQTSKPEVSTSHYAALAINYAQSSGIYNCSTCVCKEKIKTTQINNNITNVESTCDKRKYYIINTKLTYGQIWDKCCSFGLLPVSIEKKETLNCLAKEFFSKSAAQSLGTIFWTGQIDALLNRIFISCKTGNVVPNELWWKGEPDNIGLREICVAIKFDNNSAALSDLRCGESLNVICEKSDTQVSINLNTVKENENKKQNPVSISYSWETITIHKSTGLFNCSFAVCNNETNSDAKDLYEEGCLITGCSGGKNYYVIHRETTVIAAWKACCKIGMKLASFSSLQELNCFKQEYKRKNKGSNQRIQWLQTSLIDANLDGNFISCLNRKPLNNELWREGEPKNINKKEACVATSMWDRHPMSATSCKRSGSPVCEATGIFVPIAKNLSNNMRNTSANFLATSCISQKQSLNKEHTKSTLQNPLKEKPLFIPFESSYNKNTQNYYKSSGLVNCSFAVCNKTYSEAVKTVTGIQFDGCSGRTYYVIYKTMTVIEAWTACCDIGMRLTSFYTREDFDCFKDKYIENNGYKGIDLMHTSQIDANLDFNYISCLNGESMKSELWNVNEPNNAYKDESCVGGGLLDPYSGMFDSPCNRLGAPVCEVFNLKLSVAATTIKPSSIMKPAFAPKYNIFTRIYFNTSGLLNCSLFAVCNQNDTLAKVNEKGLVINGCNGKTYYIIQRITTTVPEAWTSCCSLGMKLSTFDTAEELRCVKKQFIEKNDNKKIQGLHTSILDANLDYNFISCLTGKPINKELWEQGEPNNARKEEACVGTVISSVVELLFDGSCKQTGSVPVCEAPGIFLPKHLTTVGPVITINFTVTQKPVITQNLKIISKSLPIVIQTSPKPAVYQVTKSAVISTIKKHIVSNAKVIPAITSKPSVKLTPKPQVQVG